MQFLLLTKSNETVEAGLPPSDDFIAAVGKFNDDLSSAGVLVNVMGIAPSSDGARVSYHGQDREVTDGPFPHPEQLIAGFWIIEVPSGDDAVEWAKKAPFTEGEMEIRQVL